MRLVAHGLRGERDARYLAASRVGAMLALTFSEFPRLGALHVKQPHAKLLRRATGLHAERKPQLHSREFSSKERSAESHGDRTLIGTTYLRDPFGNRTRVKSANGLMGDGRKSFGRITRVFTTDCASGCSGASALVALRRHLT